jgi:hypothetical protein
MSNDAVAFMSGITSVANRKALASSAIIHVSLDIISVTAAGFMPVRDT